MKVDNIKKILCIGSGTMGQQIGLQCALNGYETVIYSRQKASLDKAMENIERYLSQLTASNRVSVGKAEETLKRISMTNNEEEAAEEVDLVSESIPEDPELKKQVFAKFNRICPERTIFTTNTSTLLPSMFAEASGRPERFAALHFHSYVWNSTVVDIMSHPGTSEETMKLLQSFAVKIGQIPIVITNESYNYVFNAMLSSLNKSAISLVVNGVTTVENVDRAWRGILKMPIGPFGMMDHVGLDTSWQITDYWANKLNDPELHANAEFLKKYVDEGKLGVKSGQGFYKYRKVGQLSN
ncbi:3-hydroxyacyl-CoA dehydrogenase [Bacillus cereus]|uniref:3-hydroxyacyl-CoA dehydrogenase n=1 Tax=Bacillus cereus TaxID=1396 RepID=A0AB73UGJ1_BACCE|nr:3-hydroxyacyl-CoA dehydrogenase [Bacillus cereus]QHV02370.1 3-hydroxybutyryl-CoA dehydrogenase [Bacillus cereus]QHV43058.1 3-hydroxyacyl-CoA dehydrogenase [Bacillus cereus]